MRVLFSSSRLFGHLLPMLPLAGATGRAGHEVAVLTSDSMAGAVGELPMLPAGPTWDDLLAETFRQTGEANPADPDADPSAGSQLFAGIRVDLGFGESLAAAEAFGPDLIVCEVGDFVGPMVAAALGVPWVAHGAGLGSSGAFFRMLDETVASSSRYADRRIIPTARVAFVDPWPETMQPDGWVAPADRVAIRPQAYAPDGDPDGDPWLGASFPGRDDRPLVLITLGTGVDDRAALEETLASVVSSEDINAVVTLGPRGEPKALDADRARVHPVGFVPLGRLLGGVDLVVAAGGAGTVLGALSRGLPMVLLPMVAEQPLIAERVANYGAAAVVGAPDRVGEAVGEVLADPSYRAAAAAVARRMERINPPEEALRLLLERVAGDGRPSGPGSTGAPGPKNVRGRLEGS